MEKIEKDFRRAIYNFCEENVGQVVISTNFFDLYPLPEVMNKKEFEEFKKSILNKEFHSGLVPLRNETVSKKDLVNLTFFIIDELVRGGRLEETHIPVRKDPNYFLASSNEIPFVTSYPYYKILK